MAVLVGALAPVGTATAAPAPPGDLDRTAVPVRMDRAAVPPGCQPADDAFRPTSIKIPKVVGRTRVLARGRDRSGVPKAPPLTGRGKWQLAWDRTVQANARWDVVRLTAHTYPTSKGAALGNRLLARLRTGQVLVVSGPRGARVCYRVIRRASVPAGRSFRPYYSSGPHRLGIIVCSGVRRGPGDWSRRTVWLAAPIHSTSR